MYIRNCIRVKRSTNILGIFLRAPYKKTPNSKNKAALRIKILREKKAIIRGHELKQPKCKGLSEVSSVSERIFRQSNMSQQKRGRIFRAKGSQKDHRSGMTKINQCYVRSSIKSLVREGMNENFDDILGPSENNPIVQQRKGTKGSLRILGLAFYLPDRKSVV